MPRRALAWLYNLSARLLLHVPIRECRASATVPAFRRSVLAEILPESEGAFVQAEVLARAKQRGLGAVEVVSHGRAGPGERHAEGGAALASALLAMLRFWWCRIQFPASPAIRTATRTSLLLGIVLVFLAAVVFYSDLNHPLLDPDEGRQAEFPREMLEHHDLLVPRMLGDPYYDKPPLQYWLTAGVYALLGIRPWVARLIPATAALATVLLTFLWGRRALGERAGFLGAAGLCLTAGFILLGRTVVLDSLLTACVVASWSAAYSAVAGSSLRRRWWVVAAIACGLGVLTKGPVAMVLVVPPVLACQCLVPAFARPRLAAWGAFIGLALAVAGPWYTAMAIQEPNYLKEFVWKNHVLRYVQAYIHAQPWWFYLPILIGLTFPWSLLWPALVYFLGTRAPAVTQLRTRGLGFTMLSLIWWVLFYSASESKSPPYMQPAMVPLALLLGACLDARLQQPGRSGNFVWDRFERWWPRWTAKVMLLAVAGCALATWLLGWQSWKWALAEALGALVLLALWWRLGHKAGPGLAWAACAAATLAFNLFAVQDLMAGVAGRHSPAGIARKIRRWTRDREPIIWMYGRQLPSASFYLRRDGGALFCPRENLDTLLVFMHSAPETLVMVETGPLLDELVHNIPPTLETEVVVPDREGQIALVVVRQRPAPAGAAGHE